MKMIRTIKNSIKGVIDTGIKAINRSKMPVDFAGPITRDVFSEIAENAVESVKKKKIFFEINEAVIYGNVKSNSNLSEWDFRVDFNDYGEITGKYWLYSDNDDSPIPRVIAERMQELIVEKLYC